MSTDYGFRPFTLDIQLYSFSTPRFKHSSNAIFICAKVSLWYIASANPTYQEFNFLRNATLQRIITTNNLCKPSIESHSDDKIESTLEIEVSTKNLKLYNHVKTFLICTVNDIELVNESIFVSFGVWKFVIMTVVFYTLFPDSSTIFFNSSTVNEGFLIKYKVQITMPASIHHHHPNSPLSNTTIKTYSPTTSNKVFPTTDGQGQTSTTAFQTYFLKTIE